MTLPAGSEVLVAAYAAAPPGTFDPAAETALYDGLAALGVAGLEQPFFSGLHRHDEGFLLGRLRPEWNIVLTVLPGTMDRMREDSAFGLASADGDGRKRAVGFMASALRAVERLNARMGRRAVRAVAVHSAPRPTPSWERFAESLTELRSWDWMGATLLVEHCDAARPDGAHDKGFLRLPDEVSAVRGSAGRTPAACSLNWGRSALEGRSERTPLEQAAALRASGLYGGLFFSGVTPTHPDYGAWKDSHAPFSTACPASLLTPEAAAAVLALGAPPLVGLKVQPLPASLDVPARLAVVADGLSALTHGTRHPH
ncbi:MAG: UDP-N-acetylglucosamine pyrophosphorylase [Elusimicrobia bacterium]|nr:MAG: UDP-N-acetylglucosamine pyrophosphorylase [Elusimicrobiota bacterium]